MEALTLIPTTQLEFMLKTLSDIRLKLDLLETASSSPPAMEEEILTTKEAMATLKISHLNTFKSYLERNGIFSIDEAGPKRYLKSEVLRVKKRSG